MTKKFDTKSIFTQNNNAKCTKSLYIECKVTISPEIINEIAKFLNKTIVGPKLYYINKKFFGFELNFRMKITILLSAILTR